VRPLAPVSVPGTHSLTIELPSPSWVEVIADDGRRLEYSLLPAGTEKTYRSDRPLEIRIGNADGSRVAIDGKPVDIDGFRRANVAHFHVQMQDGKATPADM
jgi:cytoskeleton protein RodZ